MIHRMDWLAFVINNVPGTFVIVHGMIRLIQFTKKMRFELLVDGTREGLDQDVTRVVHFRDSVKEMIDGDGPRVTNALLL